MNMIERVARAISESQYPEKDVDIMWRHTIPDARAAINAMRDPTDDMLYDGAESHVRYYDEATEPEFQGSDPTSCDIAQFHYAYDAMISTALDGK
jgi:hypothetical protein